MFLFIYYYLIFFFVSHGEYIYLFMTILFIYYSYLFFVSRGEYTVLFIYLFILSVMGNIRQCPSFPTGNTLCGYW